eukprot:scaffold9990_cov99-Isochrysis_galbana.AAC.1
MAKPQTQVIKQLQLVGSNDCGLLRLMVGCEEHTPERPGCAAAAVGAGRMPALRAACAGAEHAQCCKARGYSASALCLCLCWRVCAN